MKKKFLAMLACVAVMTMAVSFCACGNKTEDTKTNETVDDAQDEEKEDSEDTSSDESSNDTTVDGKYASVEEYLNSDIMKAQLQATVDSLQGSGMNMDIKAEGNKLIYSYQYTEVTETEGMAEALEAAMEEQASTFQTNADSLKTIIDADELSILIEYIDANGTLIYSREFPAQ